MFPIAIILKEKSSSSKRTIAYETSKKYIVIVQQEYQGKDWKTVKHMTLPVVTFDFIQSFRFEKASLKGAQYTLEFLRAVLVSLYLTQTFWEMILEEFSMIKMFKKYLSTKIRKSICRIWNSLKTFGKFQQLLKLQIQQPRT